MLQYDKYIGGIIMINRVVFILLTFTALLYSHPHTFIEVYPKIEIKNGLTTKINFKWKMDEMTSSMLIMEFDQDGDGIINNIENEFVFKNYFLPLGDYNFYTDIKVKDKTEVFPKPINFKVFIENNRICYEFDIKKDFNIKDTKFDFGDSDFFVAMVLKEQFINITGAKPKVIELDNDFYFGYRLELNEGE